jgi:small multidrug resistance pump
MTAWFYLFLAILFEISGTTAMKLSDGFVKLFPSILMFVFYIMSLSSLTLALKKIELSIAYAIWGGVGTAIVALIGIAWFNEQANLLKFISLALVTTGVIGLHISSSSS